MKQYKAIFFDIDGTLLDTFEMNFVPLTQIVQEELGIPFTLEQTKPLCFQPGLTTMRQLGFPDVEASYARWVAAVNAYEKGAVPFDGMMETLHALQNAGIRLAVVSSKMHKQYGIDMGRWGMDRLMETAVLAEDTVHHKPHPEPLQEALCRMQLQPEDVLYVGDGPSDSEAAFNAGIDFGFAEWGAVKEWPMPAVHFRFESPLDMIRQLL